MMKKFIINFIVFVFSLGCFSISQAQVTNSERSMLFVGDIFTLEKTRDDVIAHIRKYESDIQKCNNMISNAENIIRLAQEKRNVEAEKIAHEASIRSNQAREKNMELKESAKTDLIRIESRLTTMKNELSNELSRPHPSSQSQNIKSLVTNYSGRVSVKKKDGEILQFGKNDPVFLEKGDEIATSENSSAELKFLEGRGDLKIGADSRVKMEEDNGGKQVMNLIKGKVNISVEKPENYQMMLEEKINAYKEDLKTVKDEFKQKMVDELESLRNKIRKKLEVRTPNFVVAIRDTRFLVYEDNKTGTEIIVLEGSVEMTGIKGGKTIIVNAGYKGTATKDGIQSDPQQIDLSTIERWWE